MKTLYLEKRGCNFSSNDENVKCSDVGNYRVCAENIQGKDGNVYFLEFCHWTKYVYRTTHKRTGKELKHPVRELENINALFIRTCHTGKDGLSWGNLKLENEIVNLKLDYTIDGILAAVNYISIEHYNKIEFI